MSHWRRMATGPAAVLALLGSLAAPAGVMAHPLGNFTVNRAIAIEVGTGVEVRYLVDMAEIPAFEAIQRLDADDDGSPDPAEVEAYAAAACADARAALRVTIDAEPVPLAEVEPPTVSFPAGAGGLETLRLECHFVADEVALARGTAHTLEMDDDTDDGRIGWREVTARPIEGASVIESDVPEVSPSADLTAYPEAQLSTPPDVRSATLAFRIGEPRGVEPAPAAPTAPVERSTTAADPLAALVGGELSAPVVALAILLSLGLGALHALSPGHGKTLVAAYVLGAGGTARSAAQIGLSVAVSHTAGVFALGVLTLLASELFLPERVIGWLSLVSGFVVAGLGLLLLARQWPSIRRRAGTGHGHDHDQPHGHDHSHDHHHGHTHEAAPGGALTWRSALALGFAGGSVPSASAVIVLLVAISTDRIAFGGLLIAMFGIGMAVVLGGLGLVVARIGSAASRAEREWLRAPWVRRIGPWVPVAAGAVVLVSGLAFAVTAANQLS